MCVWGWGAVFLAEAGLAYLQGFLGEGYGSHPQPCPPGLLGSGRYAEAVGMA